MAGEEKRVNQIPEGVLATELGADRDTGRASEPRLSHVSLGLALGDLCSLQGPVLS